MRRVLFGVVTVLCVLAALILSPKPWWEGSWVSKVGRRPTAQEVQWFQEKVPGLWVVRFDSGATANWELKVKGVHTVKRIRKFCGFDEESWWERWVSSALACGGGSDLRKYPVYSAVVTGTATSDVALLSGPLEGRFDVYEHENQPNHITFAFSLNNTWAFQGELASSGTGMKGTPEKGFTTERLGAFTVRRASEVSKPVTQVAPQ